MKLKSFKQTTGMRIIALFLLLISGRILLAYTVNAEMDHAEEVVGVVACYYLII